MVETNTNPKHDLKFIMTTNAPSSECQADNNLLFCSAPPTEMVVLWTASSTELGRNLQNVQVEVEVHPGYNPVVRNLVDEVRLR